MSAIGLAALPSPPAGRTGWPWTETAPPLPPARAGGSLWPRITIVTPSYNQGRYIEETIRSILLQGYPELEYIIMDAGSSDQSIEIIRKYAPWLSHWESVKDRGQAHAINKGLARATGEIFQWINSDDVLCPGALESVGSLAPEYDCIAGYVTDFSKAGKGVRRSNRGLTAAGIARLSNDLPYHQPGVWLRTGHAREIGGFNETLHYSFDPEFMVRYLERWPRIQNVEADLVDFRIHEASKSYLGHHLHNDEHVLALERLSTKLTTLELRAACRRFHRELLWQNRVNALRQSGLPVRNKLLELGRGIAHDPFYRLDRFTLGAVRAIIAGD